MRNFSFILAFALVFGGNLMAGSSESNLPGVGTFAYTGSSVAQEAAPIVVAGLTLARR